MASLGHLAVGMAAARAQGGGLWRMVGFSALSMLLDAGVIAFSLGIPYRAPFGHRGASHSSVAAAVVALVVGLVGILSERGLHCMTVEALMVAPRFLHARWLRPRRP